MKKKINNEELKEITKAIVYLPIAVLFVGYYYWYEDFKEKAMKDKRRRD